MRLAVVALVSLVAGGISTGFAAVALDSPEATVQVPMGNYGDTVTYATQWDYEETGPTPGRVELHGVTQWTLDASSAPDQTGQVFQSVRVREDFTATDGTTRSSQAFVDPHLRSIKRLDTAQAFIGAIELGDVPTENQGTLTLLGPSFAGGVAQLGKPWIAAAADTPSSAATLLLLQGTRLAPGTAVPLESGEAPAFLHRTRDATVTLVGQTDDGAMAVLDVRETGIATWIQPDWGTLQNRHIWNVTLWMSEDSPYPIRIEESVQQVSTGEYGQATSHVRRTLSLLEFEAGDRPIQWGTPARVEPAPTIQWNPGQVPSSDAWRGPLSLEAGLEASSSPHLTQFAAWRAEHPDHRLVGFYLRPGTPTYLLTLVFGAPTSENLFYIFIEERPGLPLFATESLPHANGVGPVLQPVLYGPDMRAHVASVVEWAPRLWPSLASLDQRWRFVANEEAFQAGPTTVKWGLVCPCAMSQGELWQDVHTIRYGRYAPSSATDSPFDHWGSWDHVFFDTQNGDIRYARSSTMRFQSPDVVDKQAVTDPPTLDGPSPPELAPWVVGFSASLVVALVLSWKALRSAGLVMYARLLPTQLLMHPVRQQFLDSIRASPGIGAPRLSQLHAVPWSTTMHHLRRMAAGGYITSERDGRHRRYFAAGQTDAQTRKILAVVQNERTRNVLDLVRENPGINRTTLAAKCNVSIPGVLWHLDRLAGAGLIRSTRTGRVVLYFRDEGQPTPLGAVSSTWASTSSVRCMTPGEPVSTSTG